MLPRIRLQNTYRLEPSEEEKFKAYIIEPRVYEILENTLKKQQYDPIKCNIISKELSQEIMREVRNIMTKLSARYKIVSHVIIGQVKGNWFHLLFLISIFLCTISFIFKIKIFELLVDVYGTWKMIIQQAFIIKTTICMPLPIYMLYILNKLKLMYYLNFKLKIKIYFFFYHFYFYFDTWN